jgi:hypothetical protein
MIRTNGVGRLAEYRFVFSIGGDDWAFLTEDKNNNAGRENAQKRAWDDARDFVGASDYPRVVLKSVAKTRTFGEWSPTTSLYPLPGMLGYWFTNTNTLGKGRLMENKTTLIRAIVRTIDWKNRAEGEWYDRACWRLDRLIDMLPHGAGINSTSEIIDYKTDKQGNCTMVSFRSDFHHMNADGHYDGWTQHTVKIHKHKHL